MNINIFSFFSGAGFLDLGFEAEGFKIAFVNEYNKAFLDVYQYARKQMSMSEPNFGYYCGNINDFFKKQKKDELEKNINILREEGIVGFIGGPPCPDFSIAGKNEGIVGENGSLTSSYKRLILNQEPDFFVFENVKGLWSTKKHRVEYDKIKKSFKRKGYILVDKLVNALEYGVPQDRERIILFGIKYQLLNENKKEAFKVLQDKFTWGIASNLNVDNIKNLEWPITSPFEENVAMERPAHIIPELCVEYWFTKNDVYNHFNANDYFIPKSVERFTTIQEGDVSRKSFKRLHRWRYSPTVAYGNNEVHLHPYKARRLSVAEALAIQSLPKEFILPKEISKSDMFKTISNGVPFELSKGIAHGVRKFIEEQVNI